jgi:hypothetical protein
MAKKGYSRMTKIQPAVQTMTFSTSTIPSGGGSESFYIDLSQCASLVNRRFYRQGINWAVSGFKILTSALTGSVLISKLPNTWVMSNAWEKGFRAWHKQQREALEAGDQESVMAKFNDFKIFADAQHLSDGVSRNLLPLDGAGNQALPGEWEASQIVIPNFQTVGTNIEPFIRAVGATDLVSDSTQFSLIEAYANSRRVPQSPDPAVPAGVLSDVDNIYRAMFDVGDNDDQVMDNAVGKNDNLPYPQTFYPGGDTQLQALENHSFEFITSTTIGGTTRIKGGNFPCGLIRIDATNSGATTANIVIQLDLVPGNHRGYLCEPMTDM